MEKIIGHENAKRFLEVCFIAEIDGYIHGERCIGKQSLIEAFKDLHDKIKSKVFDEFRSHYGNEEFFYFKFNYTNVHVSYETNRYVPHCSCVNPSFAKLLYINNESNASIIRRVSAAWFRHSEKGLNWKANTKLCDASISLLKNAYEKLELTSGIYFKIIKLARGIASLDKSENIKPEHTAEAINYFI